MTLPPNWQEKPLSEVVTFNPRHDRGLPDDLDVSFVPMPKISERSRYLSQHDSRKLGDVKRGYTHFRDGDVLFAKITPCMENGKAAIASSLTNGLGCGTTELHVLRPSDSVLPEWLYYYVWQERIRKEAERNMTGSAGQLRVPLSFLEEQAIPVPDSIDEQRQITNKLDHIAAHLGDTRVRLETIPSILKRFRMSVLAAACSGRLTEDWRKQHPECSQEGLAALELKRISVEKRKWALENLAMHSEAKRLLKRLAEVPPQLETDESLPSSWIKATMSELCHLVVDCHNKTAPYAESGIPLVRTTNVKDGQLILDGIKYVTDETYSFWSRRCPPESGDIIFTREAPIGDACIVPDGHTVCLGQRTMLFRTWHGLSSNTYLLYAILSPIFRTQYEDYAVGGGVVHLRVGDVEGLRVPVPPYNEQLEIVRRVQAMFELATTIEARYRKAKTFTDKLMPAVLAKAFRGELL